MQVCPSNTMDTEWFCRTYSATAGFVAPSGRHRATHRLTTIARMTTALPTDSISLSTAAALTGRSTRTWQRRIEDGLVPRLSDASGRTLVPFDAVRPALTGSWDEEDIEILLRADRGDAAAQADMGAKFALAALREDQKISGGGILRESPSIFYPKQQTKARRMPCTGWACSTPPGWVRQAPTTTPKP